MEEQFIKKAKNRLEQEEAQLELELTDIGHLHNAASGDWKADQGDLQVGPEDENILADKFEEITTNEAIVDELEVRLKNVKKALQKIEEGSYGICESCGSEIEQERLEANPAASLCFTCATQKEEART